MESGKRVRSKDEGTGSNSRARDEKNASNSSKMEESGDASTGLVFEDPFEDEYEEEEIDGEDNIEDEVLDSSSVEQSVVYINICICDMYRMILKERATRMGWTMARGPGRSQRPFMRRRWCECSVQVLTP
jgi:hypothetical protein